MVLGPSRLLRDRREARSAVSWPELLSLLATFQPAGCQIDFRSETMQRKLFELAVGLVPLGALSKALGPILRAVVGAAERSTVWSKVIATSGNWAGTSVPHTFVLVADNGSEY